jgi:hypothetical protein
MIYVGSFWSVTNDAAALPASDTCYSMDMHHCMKMMWAAIIIYVMNK